MQHLWGDGSECEHMSAELQNEQCVYLQVNCKRLQPAVLSGVCLQFVKANGY